MVILELGDGTTLADRHLLASRLKEIAQTLEWGMDGNPWDAWWSVREEDGAPGDAE
jgi:hypothetical protein